MSKNRKRLLFFTIIMLSLCIGFIIFRVINPVFLFPEPWRGHGIYRINGIDPGEGLVWSTNGQNLAGLIREFPLPHCYFCGESYSEIFVLNTESWERKTLSKTKFHEKDVIAISWLPDSSHIAYVANEWRADDSTQTWSIGIDGNDNHQFMRENGTPIWSPNGLKIALASAIEFSGDWFPAIYILDTTNNKKELVFTGNEPTYYLSNLSWSPDGRLLAFSYGKIGWNETPKPNIFFLEIGTGKITQITNDEFEYWDADFSPTKNLIALQRVNDNAIGIENQHRTVIRDLDRNCYLELPIPSTYKASWSPDGQKLVISSGRKAYIVDLTEFIGPTFKKTGSICQ